MAFGIGTTGDTYFGTDGSDTWGGPLNGVDITDHTEGNQQANASWHANISVDTYVFLMIIGALALLWFFGGVVFKNASF